MNDDIKSYLKSHNVIYEESEKLEEAVSNVDVVYQTRIQRERFSSMEEYERTRGIFIIDRKILDILPEKAIVMHPLPRVDEIKYEVDGDRRSAYFRQAHNGLFIRMAILSIVLEK